MHAFRQQFGQILQKHSNVCTQTHPDTYNDWIVFNASYTDVLGIDYIYHPQQKYYQSKDKLWDSTYK